MMKIFPLHHATKLSHKLVSNPKMETTKTMEVVGNFTYSTSVSRKKVELLMHSFNISSIEIKRKKKRSHKKRSAIKEGCKAFRKNNRNTNP